MRKLLVSDYDGTYKISEEGIITNNEKISEFREEHEFMFSTGRNYQEFFEEFEKYKLLADYYSLADGNVLMDSKFNILSINTIPKDFIDSFKKFYPYFESVEKVDAFGDSTIKDIVEYKVVYKDLEAKKKFVQFLLENGIYSYHHNSSSPLTCRLFNPYANKIDTIYKVSAIDTIPKADIHTIGDGFNDQGMIEEFNGYAISSAKQSIIDISKKTYDSVGELADDIRRKRI